MTTTLSFLFVLGVLVFVHELGHFLVARWYGVRVITFSLGFGPKLVKVVRGGTEYCISIVPLGGYVKLAGESIEENRTGAPDEFLSKSKWVRFQVYIAGPVMNIVLAIVLLAGVLSRGADVPLYVSSVPVIGSIAAGSPAESAGLKPGDRVISVDQREMANWDDFSLAVLPKAGRPLAIVVERGGQRVSLTATPIAQGRYEAGFLGARPVLRPFIAQVNAGSPAENAGVHAGDVLVSIDDGPLLNPGECDKDADYSDCQLRGITSRIRASANAPLSLRLDRAGVLQTISVVPQGAAGAGMIGVSLRGFEMRRIDPTAPQAMRMSLAQNWDNTVMIGRTLRGLFARDTSVRQLTGPIGIAQMSGDAARSGWIAIFGLMAMISLNLGLLNLLPVPVLDGGHIAILAVEGLARRDLSAAIKERILMAGAALIMLLMVTVIYNDIARLFR